MALQYFHSLDDPALFTDFCVASYSFMGDDMTHIISNHGEDLMAISKELKTQHGFAQSSR